MTGERTWLTSSKLPSAMMRLLTGILSILSTMQTKQVQMEKFLYNILDDLESRFSQQMLIEFFLCAKR